MRKLATVLTLTLTLCLGLASSASAAPRTFFGVVPGSDDPTSADLNRMGKGRVGQIRLNFYWPSVQPFEGGFLGGYDWSRYDNLVRRAAQNGIRVFPTVYGSPNWAADQSNHPPTADHLDEFEDFAKAAVDRYGPGGTFWALNPLVPAHPIIDWQCWNEVNSPTFWRNKPSAKSYKPVLAAFSRGVKAGSSSARVVLAGLFNTPQIKNGIRGTKYLRALYRTGAKNLFDSVAIHPYALNPQKALKTINQVRRVMKRAKDGKATIYVTELGWATSGIRTPVTVKPKVQARYLRKTFKKMAKSRKRRHIAGVFWYSFRDRRSKFWIYRTGLLTHASKAKPSWKSYVKFTRGRPG